jgi:ligand-binding sensor domain-containing protein
MPADAIQTTIVCTDPQKVDYVGTPDGLSSDYVTALCEDHEGDLWVATTRGIDLFRETRVTSFPTPRKGTDEADAVLAS